MATYYSRPIETPKTARDGICNFVQMIINEIEAGNSREALLKAVDLLDDLRSGAYSSEIVEAATAQSAADEAAARRHASQLTEATENAYRNGSEAGAAQERTRLAQLLGLSANAR